MKKFIRKTWAKVGLVALVFAGSSLILASAEVISGSIDSGSGVWGHDYLLGSEVFDLGPASSGSSISGNVSNLSFGTMDNSTYGSWLQIGFVAKNRADDAVSSNASAWLFNQSAFLTAYEDASGNLLVMPGDTNMAYGTPSPGGPGGYGDYFDLGTGVSSFQFTLDVIPDGSGPGGDVVLSVTGQPGTKSWKYGYDNWEWLFWNLGFIPPISEREFDGSFQDAYAVAQGYHLPQYDAGGNVVGGRGGHVRADISMTADPIPEASTLILFGTGFSGLLFLARKKRLIKF
ncbi:PEP-CTERM sorting domain-containing protein [bacterium]|nr:PEP-CTERM sorting domain-containing protein [bacterium]